MEENFGTLTDLGIRFQEAVLAACDEAGIDPSNLSELDWNDFYTDLTEENFDVLVVKAVDVASGEEEYDWENNDWLYMEEMERRYSFLTDSGESGGTVNRPSVGG